MLLEHATRFERPVDHDSVRSRQFCCKNKSQKVLPWISDLAVSAVKPRKLPILQNMGDFCVDAYTSAAAACCQLSSSPDIQVSEM